jgi:hypothetical protein
MTKKKATDSLPRRRAEPKRTDDETVLWARVLRECAKEFERTFGVPWNPHLKGLGKRDLTIEREARDVYQRLRNALKDAMDFVRRANEKVAEPGTTPLARLQGGPAARTLMDHVPERIGPLARQTWLNSPPWPRPLPDRAQLVTILDNHDLFHIPSRPDGASRFMNDREMALVSLLAGNRPKLSAGPLAYTPAEVIKLEVTYMRPLLKKHGRNGITDDDRGPLAGTRSRRGDDEAPKGSEELPLAAPFGEGEK